MLKQASIQLFCAGLVSAGLVACGSYETVDSAEVPLRQKPSERPGELPELLPVQDIHQKYSMLYSAEANKTQIMAQFRVRDEYGDTIRFGRADQIEFGDSPMRIVDGDSTGLLLGFFQGTFYTLSLPGRAEGEFVLSDDLGNRVSTPLRVPKLDVTAPPLPGSSWARGSTSAGASNAQAPYTVSVETEAALLGAQLSCVILSSWYDAAGRSQTNQISSTGSLLATGKGECAFSEAEQAKLQNPVGVLQLRVELSVRQRSQDEWERDRVTLVRHVMTQRLESTSDQDESEQGGAGLRPALAIR